MEKLKVRDFLVVKNAEIEIGSITLFIGPQATGKSVIVRLIHLCKNFLEETFFNSIKEGLSKRDTDNAAKKSFEKMFPKYTWENQNFTVTYAIDEFEIKFFSKRRADGKYSLNVEFSESLCNIRNKIKKTYAALLVEKNEKKNSIFQYENRKFRESLQKTLTSSELKKLSESSLFIPAGRSFFANVNENIFSLLASGSFEFDQIISDFGSRYSTAKKYYYDENVRQEPFKRNVERIREFTRAILKGDYVYENKKDWIKTEQGKIALANSSSGQQEALPLLILLTFWPYIIESESSASFIIEEPEAHLYPTAQKDVINLISYIYNTSGKRHKFLLTTHSPYVLSAINLLILADQVKNIKPSEVNENLAIPYNSVRAYKIFDGVANSILDGSNQLISAELIDEVSIDFDREFSRLLDLKFPI